MHTSFTKLLATASFPIMILTAGIFASCDKNSASNHGGQGEEHLPDTLKVVTLYGPTSYFLYRDEPMGYDYTLVDSLARQKGMVLDLKVAKNLSTAVAMLDSGKVDLIACLLYTSPSPRDRG